MKLNPKAIALASSIISVLISVVCVIFIAILPVQTMNFFGWLIHIKNLAGLIGEREITLANSLGGIIFFFVVSHLLGWLFAQIYNKFAEKEVSK